jgi:phage terminase small subunit
MGVNQQTEMRYRVFAQAYATNGFNATQAALEAGYSPRTAMQQGQRLLKNVDLQRLISEFTVPVMDKNELTFERVLRLVAVRTFGTLADLGTWDDEGFHLFPSDDLSEEQKQLLKKVKTTVHEAYDPKTGGLVSRRIQTEVEKFDSLDLAAQYLGIKPTTGKIRINVDNRKQSVNFFEKAGLTREEMLAIARLPLSTEVDAHQEVKP